FLERETVARLRTSHEALLFHQLRRRCLARISVECDAHPHGVLNGRFRFAGLGWDRRTDLVGLAIAGCSGLCPFCRFRVNRRPEWPLVSTRERGFPTIGQRSQLAASLCDAPKAHLVVTERVTADAFSSARK